MPSKIDQNLLPAEIRASVDPDILARAQSIEWSIDRDTGVNEHGYLDGGHEDYLSSQNLLPKTHGALHYGGGGGSSRKSRKMVEWQDTSTSGRDSGFEFTPTSPALGLASSEPFEEPQALATSGKANSLGQMKRHPMGQSPFPMYRVNQEQLQGDVFFEAAPRAAPGERTVHYERTSRILNEHEMDALGLDPKVFGPNSRTTVDETEEENVETSVLKGDARELEDIYNSMRTGAGDYFDHQRARSASPSGNRRPIESESSSQKKTIIFGSVEEIDRQEQEYFPYRDAHQGKPLPGDNEYGTWGSRFDEQRQWKLCNGQWVRVAPPKPAPKEEKYLAERLKCKPSIARSEPLRQPQPQGSTDSETDDDSDDDDDAINQPPADLSNLDLEPIVEPQRRRRLEPRSLDVEPEPPRRRDSFKPLRAQPRSQVERPVDLDALRDKYRPKVAEKEPEISSDDDDNDTKASPDYNDDDEPTGTIILEPIRPPTPPVQKIEVKPIQQTYVEMKKPLKDPDGEEDKRIEDPNLLWMRMGPAQYGPPFGSMKRRKAREEEWIGPPCELCHKQIEERRCMLAENMKFHCWHFACSFCLKTLKPADFLIAEADRKPYCLNCHKREFPEISLVNLQLEAGETQ